MIPSIDKSRITVADDLPGMHALRAVREAAIVFGGGALLLFLVTHGAIPAFARFTGIEPVVWWFICGGGMVFGPLALTGVLLLRGEAEGRTRDALAERLWLRRMTAVDWWWTAAAFVVIGAASGLITLLLQHGGQGAALHPSFMSFEPLGPGRYWILAAWLPFWVLNILGEEFLWRAVLLPRQEAALGRHAWLLHAAGWLLFHVSFGGVLLLTLLPIILVLPYVVQRRRNVWIGIVLHAGLNGPAFVAISLGAL